MKAFLIVVTLIIGSQALHAQTFDEIFKQKKTQKKYLLQQIAALQLYIGYAKKGYAIARQGITAISDVTNGELNLHASYFSSLKSVNPTIKNYGMVADIVSLQVNVMQIYRSLLPLLRKSDSFNEHEMHLVTSVFDRVTQDCTALTDDLIAVMTTGRLALTDDERLARIGQLHTSMQNNLIFSKTFSDEALGLAGNRKKEKADAFSIDRFYKINQGL